MNFRPFLATLLVFLLQAGISDVFAQPHDIIYMKQENIKVAGKTTDSQVDALGVTDKQTTIVYYDGFGRPIQNTGVQASPSQNDLVQAMTYDRLGRQTKSYLPYAASSGYGSYQYSALSTDQPYFYSNTSTYLIARDGSAYTEQVFENSPLQRMLSSGTVGDGFQPGGTGTQHYKTAIYRSNSNTLDGNILLWNPDGTYTSSSYYTDNSLAVTDGKGEDNVEVLTYTDYAGHIILKRQILSGGNLDTYYLYNNAGMVNYIIPPKATAALAANSYSLTTSPLNTLIFTFTYNNKGQVTTKTVPGKGMMSIVYDPLNRPVLLQDANLNAGNKWNYIKYDVKGRVVSQGIYTDNTYLGRSGMQSYVSGLSYSNWYESRYGTLTNSGYYTNNVFPASSITPLAYAYYDDYDLNQDGSPDFSYATQSDASLPNEASPASSPLKGIPTIVSKTTLGAGLSGTWLTTVTFYDQRGNPIQSQSNNQVYYTGATTLTDTKTMAPDFTGVPQTTKVVKQTGSSTYITVYTSFSYDHMYRVTGVSQKYNSGSMTPVASYTYNELGQVIKKGLGYVNSTTWLQNVDMRYNIRGQLLTINNSKLANDMSTTKTNGDSNDVFGLEMLYDKTDANVGNTAYFDGKVSAVKWMSKDGSGTSSYERSYKYSYDGLDRYTASTYAERTTSGTGSFSNNVNGFDEHDITYDANGNILTLKRNSSTQGTNSNIEVDNLSYTYDSANPNRLYTVTDGSGSNYTGYGFRNITGTSTGNYTYDVNGNMTADPYKGLSLTYNDINRTDRITVASGQYIDYTYDAGGILLRKQQYSSSTLQKTTDYVEGFVYEGGTLSYFAMPEGRVRNVSGTLKQEFIISDQQGNARVSFEDNGSGAAVVKQENSYYGYGLALANSPVATPTLPNKNLYNGGSEWQNDYGDLPDLMQTFYRNYDAALGRFVGVDPKAEATESLSSFQYGDNNPISFNDPLGDNAFNPQNAGGPALYQELGLHYLFVGSPNWNEAMSRLHQGMAEGTYDNSGTGSGFGVDSGDGTGGNQSYGNGDLAGAIAALASGDATVRQGVTGKIIEYDKGTTIYNSQGKSIGTDIRHYTFVFATDNSGNQGEYKAFNKEYILSGTLYSPSYDEDEHTKASSSTTQVGHYNFIVRVNLFKISSNQWYLNTDLYFQGPKIDDLKFNTGTTIITQTPYSNFQNFEQNKTVLIPDGWSYLGSTGYTFLGNNKIGSFDLRIHAGVGVSTFWGSVAGIGPSTLIVHILR